MIVKIVKRSLILNGWLFLLLLFKIFLFLKFYLDEHPEEECITFIKFIGKI